MRDPRRSTLLGIWTSALILLAVAAGCIQRAPTPQSRRLNFNRASIGDVVTTQMPQPAKKVGAVFGDAIELAGVDWSPQQPVVGDRVQVTFYYRVVDDVDEDYKVFVHIEDHTSKTDRINGDHWAANGVYPTGVWRRGEVIRDQWSFTVPSFFKGDSVDLWTGFYQPGRDDRYPLTSRSDVQSDGQNRVMAVSIPLR